VWRRFFPLRILTAKKSVSVAAEDPSVSGVSGRYATALFELARDEKSIDAVKADLDRFEALLAEKRRSEALGSQSGIFRRCAVKGASAQCSRRPKLPGTSAKFLKVLTANRRLFAVFRCDSRPSARWWRSSRARRPPDVGPSPNALTDKNSTPSRPR